MKNVKLILLFLLLLFMGDVYAQNNESIFDLNNKLKTTLPLPEAASFTKYSDIPVGLFTGTIMYSVPVFTITSGKIKIPVSLDYSTNGVKVDAVSGRTGMDWNLKIGGVITRQIIGKPDETQALYNIQSEADTSWSFYNKIKYVGENKINTQPDEFSYNFLGNSGKFYFDYLGQMKESSRSGMKISTDNNFSFFKIIDVDGTEYTFLDGDENYTYTLHDDNNEINGNYGGKTSWYLKKIKNLFGDSIIFKYENINNSQPLEYLSNVTQKFQASGNNAFSSFNINYFTGGNCCGSEVCMSNVELQSNPSFIGGLLTTKFSLVKVLSGVKLTKVFFKGGELSLTYTNREDIPGEVQLEDIILTAFGSNNLINHIKIKYVYSESTSFSIPYENNLQSTYPYLKKRLFLKKLTLLNNTNSDSLQYNFDYDGINELPPRICFAQDLFGYFNGKNNQSLIPDNSNYLTRLSLTIGQSNRSVDTVFTKKGVLKKITYPTGGFTEIVYNNNYIHTDINAIDFLDTTILNLSNSSVSSFIANAPKQYRGGENSIVPYQLKLKCESILPVNPNDPQVDSVVSFSLINSLTNIPLIDSYNFIPRNDTYIPLNYLSPIEASSSYIMQLSTSTGNLKATAEFICLKSHVDTNTNVPVGGVRVAQIKNYDSNGKLENQKRFFYTDSNGVCTGKSILLLRRGEDFNDIERTKQNNTYVGNYVVNSSSFFGNYLNDNASVNYEYVIESFDSLFKEGYTITKFQLQQNEIPQTLSCTYPNQVWDFSPFLIAGTPQSNTGVLNGKEIEKSVYIKSNNSFKKIKQNKNYYSIDNRTLLSDTFYCVRQVYDLGNTNSTWKYFSHFDINRYKKISSWCHIDSTINIDYDLSNKKLETRTYYEYGNINHTKPTSLKYYTSSGQTVISSFYYPHDMINQYGNGINTINQMINRNAIHTPILNKVYKNNLHLKSDSLVYNNLFLPNYFYCKLGNMNDYELNTILSNYDILNNLREINVKGEFNSAIFDTTFNYQIASCQNSLFEDIAFTSFETSFGGNWFFLNSYMPIIANAKCGDKCYNLISGSIAKNGLDQNKNYIVSYWSQNGQYSVTGTNNVKVGSTLNGWTYYEHTVSGITSVTVSGNGLIDELRLHPKEALMTTYTYQALVGITSQTDPNGKTIYYEYDNFNRLKLMKDQDGKVLKVYQYQYQANIYE